MIWKDRNFTHGISPDYLSSKQKSETGEHILAIEAIPNQILECKFLDVIFRLE